MPITEISYLHLEEVDSTQSYAKSHLQSTSASILYCVYADFQTHGRGTHGRSWHSPKGDNLYLTCAFSCPLSPQLHQMAQIMSFSTCKVLQLLGFKPTIKWPNDIMLTNKKVAGILCEIEKVQHQSQIFIGIGMNLNMTKDDLKNVSQEATSLFLECQKHIPLTTVLFPLAEQFLHDINLYLKEGFAPFFKEYSTLMIYKNAAVLFNSQYIGYVEKMNEDGALIIRKENGTLEKIYSGSLDITSLT